MPFVLIFLVRSSSTARGVQNICANDPTILQRQQDDWPRLETDFISSLKIRVGDHDTLALSSYTPYTSRVPPRET